MKTLNAYPLCLLIPALVIALSNSYAQQVPAPSSQFRADFSDDELRQFVNANEKVLTLQLEGEKNMIQAIEDEGLTLERFNEILEEQRDPSRGSQTNEEELESFNNAAQAILDENARLEREMTSMIEEAGLDVDTYQEIMLSYQNHPDVKNRVNQMVNDRN